MDYWEVQANTLEITSEDRKDVEEKYAVRLEKMERTKRESEKGSRATATLFSAIII